MKRRKYSTKKERGIMLASSLFVLSALTVTGMYVREQNYNSPDGHIVDFSTLEENAPEPQNDGTDDIVENSKNVTSSSAKNPSQLNEVDQFANVEGNLEKIGSYGVDESIDANINDSANINEKQLDMDEDNELASVDSVEQVVTPEDMQPIKETASQAKTLSFGPEDGLTWPIVGNVLLNYSMDKTIYFPTLEQYQYNPAIVIAATVGEDISAAADGQVVSIYEDTTIGNTIVVNMGSGYEMTYGQLQNIQVEEGDYVATGEIIGSVAEPTKYYAVEGCNVYFKLMKDGEAINPLNRLK